MIRNLIVRFVMASILAITCFSGIRGDVFQDAGNKHLYSISRIYGIMPRQWRVKDAIMVMECSDSQMRDLLASIKVPYDPDIMGMYILHRNLIAVRNDVVDMRWVLVHEYGHVVWDKLITGDEKQKFLQLWADRTVYHELISEYADTSPIEGFAEEYAAYITSYLGFSDLDSPMTKWFNGVARRLSREQKRDRSNVNRK